MQTGKAQLEILAIALARQQPISDSFTQQVQLAILTPVVAAIFGGVFVGLVIQHYQGRREFLTVRTNLSIDMMQDAYAFYTRLIEVVRQRHYGQDVRDASLSDQYIEFRIAARVIESKLHAYFPDEEARYLWHGVVDMLSMRYYRFAYGPNNPRVAGMLETHSQHPTDKDIPASVRQMFPSRDELEDDDLILGKYEQMLNHAIYLVLNRKLDTSANKDAILEPGRGPRLKPAVAEPKD